MFRRLRARSFSTLDPFRRFGHLEATINPLAPRPARPDALRQDQFSQSDWERGREVYCGAIGAEFEHIDVAAERVWWAQQLETYMPSVSGFQMTTGQRRNVYTLLQQAEQFELFVAKKWPSFKRYSGEGTDSMLPALDALFAAAASRGVSDVVIGQAHRGRLGLLTSILRYPARKLFHKIGGNNDIPDSVQGIDDVSSHIGACTDRSYGSGSDARTLHLTLLPNSSHLEAINPVAVGKTRARRDESGRDAMCLLIHGDAAASGQGVVAETYALSRLEGYSVGGTVHVITNNLLGFTADASAGRSSTYASDVSKTVGAPVLHVNGESMREVLLACRLAADYRATFGKDVVIDLIGYRRHGHNELDEPSFTSPLLYSRIRARQTFPASYASSLMSAGEISPEQHRALIDRLQTHLETEFKATAAFSPSTGSLGVGSSTGGTPGTHVVSDGTAFSGRWKNMRQAAPAEMMHSPATGVAVSELLRVGAASVALPPSFHAHDRLLRSHVHARLQSLGSADGEGSAVDWSTAEALAFGTLLEAGYRVRISGQDAQRGTFSHRHAVFVDQKDGSTHIPLNHLSTKTGDGDASGRFSAVSSPLSEFAVAGFELGYSWESPRGLVLWEAQFGDFANGAQIVIDQMLSGCETKWLRQSGLVLLLPHGYDGAGPEHSSARIERFLQLCNSQAVGRGAACLDPSRLPAGHSDKALHEAPNMVVAVPTTPANYFHLLRRQLARPFRKPLVIAAPKTLLRLPAAVSALSEMGSGTRFEPVLGDPLFSGASPESPALGVRRLVFVSGKLYYELSKRRDDLRGSGDSGIALVRIEELCPFPSDRLQTQLRSFPAASSVVWCQEEPANAGSWVWAEAHIAPVLAAEGRPPLVFIGRPALAAPAVGLSKMSKRQQDFILETCCQI